MIEGTKELFKHQSPYQLIQIHEDQFGIGRILLLDEVMQLTTYDQHRYHESLVVVPYLHTRYAEYIAILGGGDGYAAKTLLDNFPVKRITLVEIDPAVVEASKAFLDFPEDSRITVVNEDAADWISTARGYDLIIADYTDPGFTPAAKRGVECSSLQSTYAYVSGSFAERVLHGSSISYAAGSTPKPQIP
ncbi:MAG: spermine/spermidine synthase domain-containing protein [Candidatus Thorarchaeota archaeon]|jgi:spermidine synthase